MFQTVLLPSHRPAVNTKIFNPGSPASHLASDGPSCALCPPLINMDSSSPTPPPLEKDHVNLRMIYLVTGNPRQPHSLGNVHLNTTIAELKGKIQSELPEHPSPPEQRLIYQGRPLLQDNATLRDVIRIEVCRSLTNFCRFLTTA